MGLARGQGRAAAYPTDGAAWLLGLAAVSLLVGATLWLFCGYQAGFARFNEAAGLLPPWAWAMLTVLGDERVAFALALFAARRHPQIFWSLVCAGVVAAAYTHGLKPSFAALRPPAVLAAGDFNLIGPGPRQRSFPSGHTVTAAVFFGVLAYHARGWPWRLALIGVAVAAGMSRVAVGVHWPIDVAAGLFGGALAALAGIWLARRVTVGARDVSVHLALVTLASIMAAALLLWDGGYADAALMQRLIGWSALGYVFLVYLALPIAWSRRPS